MGIFRGGVRVTRALTPSLSSGSSTDEEEPVAKKQQRSFSNQMPSEEGKSPTLLSPSPMYEEEEDEEEDDEEEEEDDDPREEMFQVGESVCESLPEELFEVMDVGEILSIDAWNDCLSEEERQELSAYLPSDMDKRTFDSTLRDLLGGKSFHFSCPLNEFWQNLRDGMFDPRICMARKALLSVQRKEYYHGLRGYHNGMVNSLLEMKDLWAGNPEAGLEERLYSWRSKTCFPLPSSSSPSRMRKSLLGRKSFPRFNRGSRGRKARAEQRSRGSSPIYDDEYDVVINGGFLPLEHREAKEEDLDHRLGEEDHHIVGNFEGRIMFQKEESGILMDDQSPFASKLDDEGIELPASKTKRRRSVGNADKRGMEMQSRVRSSPHSKLTKKSQQHKGERGKKEDGYGNMEGNVCSINFQATPLRDYETEPIMREVAEGSSQQRKSKSSHRLYAELDTVLSSPRANEQSSSSRAMKKPTFILVPASVAPLPFSVLKFISAVRNAAMVVTIPGTDSLEQPLPPPPPPLGTQFSEIVEQPLPPPPLPGTQFAEIVEQPLPPPPPLGTRFAEIVEQQPLPPPPPPGTRFSEIVEQQPLPPPPPLGTRFSEIVARVHASPGDAKVLEVQMPLDALVRGVLKVLSGNSSKYALKGAENPFVVYDKATRCWSWIGPSPVGSILFDESDLQSYPEMWGVTPAVLYEMQEMFGRWLKASEATLHQLWQLALLPRPEYPVFPEEKERFKDLKAQKSLGTILPSTQEMKLLFHKEEAIRYSTVEITCCYTAADGRRSAVSPLKRLGGKSKAKARDHFMLKADRPSHITILCLVRDAAARLPQAIGTRADVCNLLRDSQFIVEDVSEVQLSHVVSGALDRLHYEKDPCVRYDQDKKLWVYLHSDRNEEDFEEGGTASTRISRRHKKDAADAASCSPSAPGQADNNNNNNNNNNINNNNNEEMSEPEHESGSGSYNGSASPELLFSHPNVDPALMTANLQARDEGLLPFIDLPPSMQPFCGNMQSHPMGWEVYKAGKELSISQ